VWLNISPGSVPLIVCLVDGMGSLFVRGDSALACLPTVLDAAIGP
jgi:hypothetical protein